MGRPRRFGGYPPCHRLGLTKEDAAAYVGVSKGEFVMLVAAGDLPPAKMLGKLERWSRIDLDGAFSALRDVPGHKETVTDETWRQVEFPTYPTPDEDDGGALSLRALERYKELYRAAIDARRPFFIPEKVASELLGLDAKAFRAAIRKMPGYEKVNIDSHSWCPRSCVDALAKQLHQEH